MQLRRSMAYPALQLSSSFFQAKVREEANMPISERDAQPLIVWGTIVDSLRTTRTDARDDELLRRLIVQTLEKSRSPHLSFFISINPCEPSLDTMLTIMLSLHTQHFTPSSISSSSVIP